MIKPWCYIHTLLAGPPKQFATLCGLMFSSLAFFFYLVSVYERKVRAAALLIHMHAGACAEAPCGPCTCADTRAA